ncbi:MAG: hypothetical protein VW268_04495 [Rhodospirillaceae bacterium]
MFLELFGRVANGLAGRSHSRRGDPSWYLEEIFTHDGRGNFTRPKNMRGQLFDAVQLEITQLPPYPLAPAKTVQCKGRLDSELDEVVVTTS